MAEQYRLTPGRRVANRVVRLLLRLGLAGKHTWLLTVVGRKSGKAYSTPVTLISEDSREWIVAPYGERQWVKNLRVAGEAQLSSGRSHRTVRASEVPAADAAAVIRLYVQRVPITRKFWDVTPTSTEAELVAEAARHPVFLVRPAEA